MKKQKLLQPKVSRYMLLRYSNSMFIYVWRFLFANPVIFYTRVRAYIRTSGLTLLFVWAALVIGLVVTLVHPAQTIAATSSTINFQSRLETIAGAIVPDGTYNVEFNLYSASSGGSSEWTEDYLVGASQGVTIVNGYLTANLGSITSFPTTIKWDQQQWLTMDIGGTSGSVVAHSTSTTGWDGEMSPRLQLTAVPYAFRAGQLALLTGSNTSVLGWASQSAARSLNLPDENGTLCVQSSANCNFAPGTSASYIQNGTSPQASANFNIDGSGTIGTGLTVSGGGITVTGNSTIAGTLGSLTGLTSTGTIQGGIVNATTGFEIGGAATTGHYLRGNGTNYVDSALLAGDISGTLFTLAATSGSNQTVSSGATVSILAGSSNNLTTTASATDTVTVDIVNNPSFTGKVTSSSSTTALSLSGTPVAGTGITSLVQIGSAISGGNSVTNGGTYLGINEPSSGAGSAADFLNFQNNGTKELQVSSGGAVTAAGTLGLDAGNTVSYDLSFGQGANRTIGVETQATAATAGNNLTISAGTGNTTGGGGTLNLQGGAATATAGSAGGAVAILATNGTSTGTGAAGGAVTITSGNAGGSAANNGGNITLQAGSATSTGTNGSVIVKNAANSTTAFQVQNTGGGTSILNVDTTNNRVGINTNAPGAILDIQDQNSYASNTAASTVLNVLGGTGGIGAGSLNGASGGLIALQGGTGGSNLGIHNGGVGGAITIIGGTGGGAATSTGGNGGSVTINGGAAGTGGGFNGGPGQLILQSGGGSITMGGNLSFTNSAGATISGPSSGGLTITNSAAGGITISTTSTGTVSISSVTSTSLTSQGGITLDAASTGIGNLNLNTTNNRPIITGTGLLTLGGNLTFGGTLSRTITGPSGSFFSINSGGAFALNLDTGGNAAINIGPNNATSIVLGGNVASTLYERVANSSTTAFQLQTAGNTAILTADTTNSKLTVGATGATPILLVLANKNTSGDPTEVDGATYYNSNTGQFRCGISGSWANCANGTGLAKNAVDTSTAAVTSGNGYLYQFTNSSSAIASGVLKLDNGTNTNSTLTVTASGNPTSGQALIFASNTNASPTGNLIDLQSGSSPTSVFSVNAAGTTTIASGQSYTGAGAVNVSSGGATALGLDTGSGAALNIGTANATSLNFGSTANNAATTFKQTASATAFRVQNASGNAVFTVDTSANQAVLGLASTVNGQLSFYNSMNNNAVTLVSGVTSSAYTLTLPTTGASTGQCLQAGTVSGSTDPLVFGACGTSTGLAKNAADTSSATGISNNNFLYSFTNATSGPVTTSGVLKLNNSANTGSALSVTSSADPASGQALIFASKTNNNSTGNLIDLQAGSSPTSQFSVSSVGLVTTAGNVSIASGQSYTGAGAVNVSSGGANTLSFDTGGGAALNIGANNATSIVLGGNTSATLTEKVANSSTTAFLLQTAGSTAILTADTTNSKLTVGATGSTPVLLVLANKNTSGDPTEVDGAMYYNSNTKTFRCGVDTVWMNCGSLFSSNTATSSTISNCSSACAAFSTQATLPANYCTLGRVIQLTVAGTYGSFSTAPTMDFGVYMGSNATDRTQDVLLASVSNSPTVQASQSAAGWNMPFSIICDSTGSAGTVNAQGNLNEQKSATTENSVVMTKNGTSTIDTTAQQTIYLFPVWNTANASSSATVQQFIVTSP